MQEPVNGLSKLSKINNMRLLLIIFIFPIFLLNLFSASNTPKNRKQKIKTVTADKKVPYEGGRIVIDKIEDENESLYDNINEVYIQPLPISYGELKGSFNAGNRNILIFENSKTKVITFIEVIFNKKTLTWKYIGQLTRE